jgi:pimeloyl-ACP methyl ester carboxylesterase
MTSVERTDLTVPTPDGRHLGGWLAGDGPPVVLAHGGPGLGYEHLDGLAEELAQGYRVAHYQQRGLAPSTEEGEFTVAEAVADVAAVLDHLGWGRAWFVGHSWGGHLAFHVADALPDRLLGVVSVDPLGGVGDGAAAAFGAEMVSRAPEQVRARIEELDARDMDGSATPEDEAEQWDLVWPSYFADRDNVMPRPPMRSSMPAHVGLWGDLKERLPDLERRLPGIRVPVTVVVGERSPMPPEAAGGATAERIPGARLVVVAGAGHFPWFEEPGCVRSALDGLASA